MWTIFKVVNFVWLLASTYMWLTTTWPLLPVLFLVNVLMIICLGFMPVKIEFTLKTGVIIAAMSLIVLWETWCYGYVMGMYSLLSYMPVLYLIMLPDEYMRDLLSFTTKWYAIMLIPSLLIYWTTLFVSLPSFGNFVHPNYKPYLNYLFYIKTTYDNGIFVRFNAFFLEAGHQALLSTFLMMANRFNFRQCKWLWALLLSVFFSLSLAGYLLLFVGYVALKIDTLPKALAAGGIVLAIIVAAQSLGGGENAVNELIVKRMERDDEKGIKGNNRFTDRTDYVYKKAVTTGDAWVGLSGKMDVDDISGAGYKVYVIHYGFVGIIFTLLFYLSVIPDKPDYRYTYSFLFVLALCFIQRSYPGWYSWLFPYITGIYLAKADKAHQQDSLE